MFCVFGLSVCLFCFFLSFSWLCAAVGVLGPVVYLVFVSPALVVCFGLPICFLGLVVLFFSFFCRCFAGAFITDRAAVLRRLFALWLVFWLLCSCLLLSHSVYLCCLVGAFHNILGLFLSALIRSFEWLCCLFFGCQFAVYGEQSVCRLFGLFELRCPVLFVRFLFSLLVLRFCLRLFLWALGPCRAIIGWLVFVLVFSCCCGLLFFCVMFASWLC